MRTLSDEMERQGMNDEAEAAARGLAVALLVAAASAFWFVLGLVAGAHW